MLGRYPEDAHECVRERRGAVRFSYTHHMPYTGVTEAGQDWPVANKQFDPQLGVDLFNRYVADKIYAE